MTMTTIAAVVAVLPAVAVRPPAHTLAAAVVAVLVIPPEGGSGIHLVVEGGEVDLILHPQGAIAAIVDRIAAIHMTAVIAVAVEERLDAADVPIHRPDLIHRLRRPHPPFDVAVKGKLIPVVLPPIAEVVVIVRLIVAIQKVAIARQGRNNSENIKEGALRRLHPQTLEVVVVVEIVAKIEDQNAVPGEEEDPLKVDQGQRLSFEK
mmetsp:Transcript_17438/g.20110  ORF Transcript_17438/g.20110 Transcript_17438/m.20110 type:complete len:206 (-) Transcript_17438:841-1458(-)